jgi:hypothetical protein
LQKEKLVMQDYSIITDNIEAIKEMAAIGDAEAQNKLGVCYTN